MRTNKKHSQVKVLSKKQYRIGHRISSTFSLKNIKKHPYISLGTAAIALSALTGLVSWARSRKVDQERHFFSFRKK